MRERRHLVLGAPHAVYRDLEIPADKIVVDLWNFWPERAMPSRPNLPIPVAAGGVRS